MLRKMSAWVLLLGIVIYRRRPNDRMAYFASCVLIIYAVLISSPLETLSSLVPGGLALVFRGEEVFWTLGLANLMFIFPDGRFVPHWTRWVAVALVPLNVILLFLPGLQFDMQSMSTTDAAIQMLWRDVRPSSKDTTAVKHVAEARRELAEAEEQGLEAETLVRDPR